MLLFYLGRPQQAGTQHKLLIYLGGPEQAGTPGADTLQRVLGVMAPSCPIGNSGLGVPEQLWDVPVHIPVVF